MDLWRPTVPGREARPRLLLRCPGPVAVQVEQVVIEPPARPWLPVLACFRIRVGRATRCLTEPVDVAIPAIGIRHRIDYHDQRVQHTCHLRRSTHEIVRRPHRRFTRRAFVAVNAVAEIDDCRVRCGDVAGPCCRCSRIREQPVATQDLVQLRKAVGTRNRDLHQCTTFHTLPISLQTHHLRHRRSQRFHVVQDTGVVREPLTDAVAEHLLWRGDGLASQWHSRTGEEPHKHHDGAECRTTQRSLRGPAGFVLGALWR
jgi:hypothetical protein